MKKIAFIPIFLTLAGLFGVLFSCSKPAEEAPTTIQGKWMCSSYTMHAYDYDTIINVNDEVGKLWRFSENGWFYIDGERQGNYEIERINPTTNPNYYMDVIHLYYEIAEPSYHIERKSYGINKLTQAEMLWRITDVIPDGPYQGFFVDILIQFNKE